MTDSSENILSDIEKILDRIAKLDHQYSEIAIIAIQEGADWLREESDDIEAL